MVIMAIQRKKYLLANPATEYAKRVLLLDLPNAQDVLKNFTITKAQNPVVLLAINPVKFVQVKPANIVLHAFLDLSYKEKHAIKLAQELPIKI